MARCSHYNSYVKYGAGRAHTLHNVRPFGQAQGDSMFRASLRPQGHTIDGDEMRTRTGDPASPTAAPRSAG